MQAFIRVGNESVVASMSKHKELVLKGSNMSYDSLASRWKFGDMAFTVLRAAYFKRTNRSFEESDYESFGIINEKGELTNAGALLADYSPVRHSRLFCTRWNGLDKANGVMEALDDEEYSGSLITLLQSGMDFVRRNSKKAWRKAVDRRLEYPEYPERAVEEGLVNALIHRNYLELGSEVHIDMYDDRLEIYSPGGLMDGGSIKDMDLMNMASRRRNPVLADIFSRLKYMERRGSGFRKIMLAYKTHDGYMEGMEPTFTTPWDSFVLTLPKFNIEGMDGIEVVYEDNHESNNDQDGQKSSETSSGTEAKRSETSSERPLKSSERILELIKLKPTISAAEIAKELNMSPRGVEKQIKKLREACILKRVGADFGGHWEIIK